MSDASAPPPLRVADVVFDARQGGAEALFTYLVGAHDLAQGDFVLAPIGTRSGLGVVWKVYDVDPGSLGYDPSKLRAILERLDEFSLPAPLVKLVESVSEEFLCPLSVALSAALPPGVLDRLEERWTLVDGAGAMPLSTLQQETLDGIRASGGKVIRSKTKKLSAPVLKALKTLQAKGLLQKTVGVAAPKESRATTALFRPTPDVAQIDAFLKKYASKRPAQALTLMRLRESESGALSSADIRALCGVTESTVKQLIEAGLLVAVADAHQMGATPPTPNSAQKLAIDAIVEAVLAHEARDFLLFGVTGSGKTEVYLRAAAEALRHGRQALYLVPEIALATQSALQLRDRFGRSVAIMHSDLPMGERSVNWTEVRSGRASIVLGARSALFAPLDNIGLIILDEEHEGAYKQESSPRYHAKSVARRLSQLHGCPLVLGSATPSLETFHEADQDQVTLLPLPERAASAKLPEVHVVDLSETYRSGKPALFSDLLVEKLIATTERQEQSILFLNRRAYAPFLVCRDCGKQFVCPNCSVSLTLSRKLMRLRCHHCGYGEAPPDACPDCKGTRLQPFGIGSERVEEAVVELLPNARVARLDRDITQKKGALESILARLGTGEIDVLVGTQMVAKGLNFPGVTLVGVIAADLSLNIPDFRAAERTFQLLSQVAGRAGRGTKPGEVVIQTFNPEHIAIRAAQKHRYLDAYEELMSERVETRYPPYARLVNCVASSTDREATSRCMRRLADLVREQAWPDVELLGPTDCAIERLNTRWRQHILLKVPYDFHVAALAELIDKASAPNVMLSADVDPYSMM